MMNVARGPSVAHLEWAWTHERPSLRLVASWIASLFLHMLIGVALVSFAPRLTPGSLPEVFTWQVSLVEAPPGGPLVEADQVPPTEVTAPKPLTKPSPAAEMVMPPSAMRTKAAAVPAAARKIMPEPEPPTMTREVPVPESPNLQMESPSAIQRREGPSPAIATRIVEPASQMGSSDREEAPLQSSAPTSIRQSESDTVTQPSQSTESFEPQTEPVPVGDALPAISPAAQAMNQVLQPEITQPASGKRDSGAASNTESKEPVAVRQDYGWLAASLRSRIVELKRYPVQARSDRLEGRVVVRAVINPRGEIVEVVVASSSGHDLLDREAVDLVQRAGPLSLRESILQPRVILKIPVSYSLRN